MSILYDTVTNDLLSIRHSTVATTNGASPIARNNAQTPTMKGHHDAYSADPFSAGWLTNSVAVGQRFDTIDLDVGF